jgi:HSP20 family protein
MEDLVMAETATKLPVKNEDTGVARSSALESWWPFDSLRRQVDRLFEDFNRDLWGPPLQRSMFGAEPLWRREMTSIRAPAVDIVEKENAFEVTAELPGLDEKNIEIKFANGGLTIKGERQEEKEEKKKDYYLQERHYGAFERSFTVPDSVDPDKIEASFKKGVLTLTLPKKVEAIKAEKKITIKAA